MAGSSEALEMCKLAQAPRPTLKKLSSISLAASVAVRSSEAFSGSFWPNGAAWWQDNKRKYQRLLETLAKQGSMQMLDDGAADFKLLICSFRFTTGTFELLLLLNDGGLVFVLKRLLKAGVLSQCLPEFKGFAP
jgi:hypothetical protein